MGENIRTLVTQQYSYKPMFNQIKKTMYPQMIVMLNLLCVSIKFLWYVVKHAPKRHKL